MSAFDNMLSAAGVHSGVSQLDQIAKQRGFPDYATMQAWERHRSESLQQNSTVVGDPGQPNAMATPVPQAAPPPQENMYQKLMRVWHAAVG